MEGRADVNPGTPLVLQYAPSWRIIGGNDFEAQARETSVGMILCLLFFLGLGVFLWFLAIYINYLLTPDAFYHFLHVPVLILLVWTTMGNNFFYAHPWFQSTKLAKSFYTLLISIEIVLMCTLYEYYEVLMSMAASVFANRSFQIDAGMPLNFLGLGAGGGCGVGLGLGWGFGTAFGSQYRSSRVTFQGIDLNSKDQTDGKESANSSRSSLKGHAAQQFKYFDEMAKFLS